MGRDFSLQWQPPSQWDEMVRWAWDIPSKHYFFNRSEPIKPLKDNKYILTTTKLYRISEHGVV